MHKNESAGQGQLVSITRVSRAFKADLSHFCELNGWKIQTVCRRLMEIAVINDDIRDHALVCAFGIQLTDSDVRLGIPNVPRGTALAFDKVAREGGSNRQRLMRGILEWLSTHQADAVDMILTLEAVPEGTCD